ncbi:hypothetical protein FB567DRAFT_614331 [Paraphoma chrysanthemicola]|uniref:Uncharacterized protein n=1 Tax=Paraphoma chrysanthemicola TaxID=798071 RepID=A0A8K0RD30_9PLEO|nr:hypothetical protein FB567DRAFT_614331 [Paraphoma chrysanthemicola]
MVSLVDILSVRLAPIQNVLLSHLLPRDIITLTLTCSALGRLWQTFVATKYNINRLLRPYFDIDTLRNYLLSQGYTKDSSDCPDLEGYSRPHAKGRVVVSVIQEDPDIINEVFQDQETTASVSFITWKKAYCLYPHEILIEREYYAIQEQSDRLARTQKALAKEGLQKKRYLSLESDIRLKRRYVFARPRRVGDKHTLVIELNTTGVEFPERPDGVLETSRFRLYWREEGGKVEDPSRRSGYCKVHCQPIRYPILKYTYGVVLDKHWHLCTRLKELTLMELFKMKSSERPLGHDDLLSCLYGMSNLSELKGTFAPPEAWKYCDEEVIGFLNQSWNHQVDPERFAAPEELNAK